MLQNDTGEDAVPKEVVVQMHGTPGWLHYLDVCSYQETSERSYDSLAEVHATWAGGYYCVYKRVTQISKLEKIESNTERVSGDSKVMLRRKSSSFEVQKSTRIQITILGDTGLPCLESIDLIKCHDA